jgi:hypothetical protein
MHVDQMVHCLFTVSLLAVLLCWPARQFWIRVSLVGLTTDMVHMLWPLGIEWQLLLKAWDLHMLRVRRLG